MHVPDGFLSAPVSVATGVVALAAVGVALRGARRELDDKTVPLAGLVAAFIFAAQMIEFPLGVGTSGHLIGGALAAVLIGPWTAVLCLAVVLIVQSLLFADGGLTALGSNITVIALVTPLVGWLVFRLVSALLPRRRVTLAPAAALGALVSLPLAAGVLTGLYAVGGTTGVPLTTVAWGLIGWQTLIGVGEAVITFLALSGILAVRPDLVYGARPTPAADGPARR